LKLEKETRRIIKKNYEEIGEILTDYVYGLLESDPMNLVRKEVQKDEDSEGPKSFVFKSGDFETNPNLCVLIHGSGVVRAGQWARRLIMNENLDLGTIMSEVMMAKERGFAVLVMNINDNARIIDGDEILIEGCENACKSATTTWKSMVSESNHSKICIIAHSYGGVVSLKLADKFGDAFQKRVFAILLTDSAHFGLKKNALAERCINYVASDKTLDTDLGIDGSGIRTKSAGHQVHEWTPSSSRTKLFEAFDHLFKQFE